MSNSFKPFLVNTIKYSEPEKTPGPLRVEWSWFQCSINLKISKCIISYRE